MLEQDKTVLIVIDVQGKLATLMHQKEDLFQSLETIIKAFKILEAPIIWVEQIPDKIGKTTQEIADLLKDNLSPIKKDTFSCCHNDLFMSQLKKHNKNKLLITGIEAHICVYQTCMDLLKLGYEVELVQDCISSRKYENKKMALEKMNNEGAKITSVEMALFEILKDATNKNFKKIIPLLK